MENPLMAKDFLFNHKHNDMIRSDYRPSPYHIAQADMHLDLDHALTKVRDTMTVEPNPKSPAQGGPLILNGEDIDLTALRIKENGVWRNLDRSEFTVDDKFLTILRPPAGTFELQIENEFSPDENTKLMGIYSSGDMIGSQNESQGFRRITYFLDRPDNLTKFTTTLEADKEKYPILISNGNGDLTKTKDLGNGRHSITWVDPFPKPSYLFATIAGNMKVVSDTFTTMSGKKVDLHIVVPPGYEDKVAYAMKSLKNAMRWDEQKYGREYDLNTLHLIGLEKFNMGAMENKGAIVFNIKDLVGDPKTTTDTQLLRIETVVGHEYFHNWTGDRVTVRDWFEISLKESLTEYRNEQFASDMNSAAIETIDNAETMRTVQFREDAGPTAMDVRPERVEAFENMYGTTVYQKGAQILRMMNTILDNKEPGLWRKAMDNYFKKFDGQAVTVDDFIDNMQDVSGIDLSQFRRWYSQSGTPQVSYEGKYDPAKKTYTLTLKQHTPSTPNEPADKKKPFYIPIRVGLIGESGKDVANKLLTFTQPEQTFVFENVNGPVVPSILRDFSAPVKIVTPQSNKELIFRMANDSDPFNRYDAGNQLMANTMQNLLKDYTAGKPLTMPPDIISAYATNLAGALDGDEAFASRMLQLPAFTASLTKYDPLAAAAVQKFVAKSLADTFKDDFQHVYDATTAPAGEKYEVNPTQMGRRELHDTALGFLRQLETPAVTAEAQQQYQATNMTEKLAALQNLTRLPGTVGAEALADFYKTFHNDTNVMDTFLTVAASVPGGDVVGRVRDLMKNDVFSLTNPNKVRALMSGFIANTDAFHNLDGSGYKLLADVVISLNEVNPHTATGIIPALLQFDRYDEKRQKLMIEQLQRIAATPKLDNQINDLVGKTLQNVTAAAAATKKARAPKAN
jgi:aminopeptidase N